jgi:hypothetical protein
MNICLMELCTVVCGATIRWKEGTQMADIGTDLHMAYENGYEARQKQSGRRKEK